MNYLTNFYEKEIFKQTLCLFVILLFITVNFLFLNHNNSSDAYGYAYSMQTGTDLWNPHHLLYNPLGWVVIKVFAFTGLSPLVLLQGVNILFAAATLWVLYRLLDLLSVKNPVPFVLMSSAAFVFLRFCNENETYILPVFFSLLATYFVFSQSPNRMFAGLLISSVAVLFHQIHIFWHLGLCIYVLQNQRAGKALVALLSSSVLIGLTYWSIAARLHQPLTHFLTQDAANGLVQLVPNRDNFKFFTLNFIRSFFQVHGEFSYLFQTYRVLYAIALLAFFLVVLFLVKIFRQKVLIKNTGFKKEKNILWLILVLHMGFAWYSVGNAEFMTMLPLLIFILLALYSRSGSEKNYGYFGIALGLWNVSLAVLPHHFLDFTQIKQEYAYLKSLNVNPKTIWVSRNSIPLYNYHCYASAQAKQPIGRELWELRKTPAETGKKSFTVWADSCLGKGYRIITDCIAYPEFASRASLLFASDNTHYLKSNYDLEPVDSLKVINGKIQIYALKIPKKRSKD